MGQQEDVPYFFPVGWGLSFYQQQFRPVDCSSSIDLFIVTMLLSVPYIYQHSRTLTKVSTCIHDAAEFHSDFLAEQLYKCVGSIRYSNYIFRWVKSRLCGCPKVFSRKKNLGLQIQFSNQPLLAWHSPSSCHHSQLTISVSSLRHEQALPLF